jgi:cellulose synthase/poly-beta-1,6-N-acetylglucosamine synthase-like glycosyltransferase
LSRLEIALLAAPVVLFAYAYLMYPLLLWIWSSMRRADEAPEFSSLPTLTVVVISYNEVDNIRRTIENLLDLDYPRDRLQYLMVSDGSTDGTDNVIREYANRGVEYLRVETRGGKTAAENASLPHIRGDVVLNTDAAVRVDRGAARALVHCLRDPRVGLASGKDISVPSVEAESNWGEGAYVRYEMAVRDLETRCGGIIGASGCLFAIRRELHDTPVLTDSFRDLAAPLIAFRHGYRTVSCPEAICYVPRTPRLRDEYRRKVRTTARGLSTLWHHRALWNPVRHGGFAWKILSHKLCRWFTPVATLPALWVLFWSGGANARLAITAGLFLLCGATLAGILWPEGRRQPRLMAFLAAVSAGNIAAVHALAKVVIGDRTATWEPTRRMTWGTDASDHSVPS